METQANSVEKPPLTRILLVVSGLVATIVVLSNFVPEMLRRNEAERLCEKWARNILIDAKAEPPEKGAYEATLPVEDPWNNELQSTLYVRESLNQALVLSAGLDGSFSTADDISASRTDVHIRKVLKRGIQSGAESFGKGLARGVMEGMREETKENIVKTKRKASKLLARFKKKENDG